MFTITFPVHDTPGNFIFIVVSDDKKISGYKISHHKI